MTRQTVIAALVIVAAVGCGSSEQEEAEQAAEQVRQGAEQMQRSAEQMADGGARQMAQGLQQMTEGLAQMAQGQAEVVDFEVLKSLLPSVDGWTQSSARGEQLSMPIKISRAEARYDSGDSNIELEITDSAMNQILLAPMSMFLASGYSERSDDGFKRAARIGGYPSSEDWNTRSRRAEVITVVGNRFIVQATGHDVDDLAPVRQLVEAVNLSRLESLK